MPGPAPAQVNWHVQVSASDCQYPRLAASSGTQRARGWLGLPGLAARSRCAPALLCGLAADAEPGADLGPGVAAGAQALDRLGHRGIDLLGQADLEDQGLNIAVSDAAAVGAQDAAGEGAVLVVLDLPSRPVRCHLCLDSSRPGKLGRR